MNHSLSGSGYSILFANKKKTYTAKKIYDGFHYRLLHKLKKAQIKWKSIKQIQRRRNPRNEWEKPKDNEIKERENARSRNWRKKNDEWKYLKNGVFKEIVFCTRVSSTACYSALPKWVLDYYFELKFEFFFL